MRNNYLTFNAFINMDLSELSILVTGGAGFIGSNLVEYLAKNNAKLIRVIDNLSTGKLENIIDLIKKYNNIEFVKGDITDLNTCLTVLDSINAVSHQAALGSVPRSVNNPIKTNLNNANGQLNILWACKIKNIKRVVYASSSSVYGNNVTLPKVEDKTGMPLSPYAVTKCVNELYANVFTKLYNMECIGLRYFNVFGPKQDPNGQYAAVIPKFISLLKKDKRVVINGDGSYSRDFTYIDNVVKANVLALTFKGKIEDFGKAYNIGAGGRVTILELYNEICRNVNKDIKPIFGKLREGDIPHSNASIDLAKKVFNYEPIVKFNEGIVRTVEYFNK